MCNHDYPLPSYVNKYHCNECTHWTLSLRTHDKHIMQHMRLDKKKTAVKQESMATAAADGNHGNQLSYPCLLCDVECAVECKTWDEYQDHIAEVHWQPAGDNELIWTCPLTWCKTVLRKGKHTPWRRVVERCLSHMVNKHNCEVPPLATLYRCSDCDFDTLVQDNLRNHEKHK